MSRTSRQSGTALLRAIALPYIRKFVLHNIRSMPLLEHAVPDSRSLPHVRAYGRFMAAISRATHGQSSSRLIVSPRLSCCNSSHFINSYTNRRWGWMITLRRRALTKQL
jgi:hypothetical protein